MDGLNVKALMKFAEKIRNLQDAIEKDDKPKQLIALTQAIDDLQETKRSLLDSVEADH
jgi:hypothetical protein